MSSVCLLPLRRVNLLLPGCFLQPNPVVIPPLISVAGSKGSSAFHIFIYISYSSFGIEVTHYYVITASFQVLRRTSPLFRCRGRL